MTWAIAKVFLAATIISFSSWLSGKMPHIAGFIIALPISSLLVLLFSYAEYKEQEAAINFARNIFVAIPVSLTFFVPFLLAGVLKLSFWQCYISGLICLTAGYFLYQYIVSLLS